MIVDEFERPWLQYVHDGRENDKYDSSNQPCSLNGEERLEGSQNPPDAREQFPVFHLATGLSRAILAVTAERRMLAVCKAPSISNAIRAGCFASIPRILPASSRGVSMLG